MEMPDRRLLLELKQTDYPRYLCALMQPSMQHQQLFSLLALDIELSKCSLLANEPMMGQIRLKWWQEVLRTIADGQGRSEHPLLPLLSALPETVRLQLPQLVNGVAQELEHRQGFISETEFFDYLAQRYGMLHSLLLSQPEEGDSEALALAAQCFGLVETLRQLPLRLAHSSCLLPRPWLLEAGAVPEALQQGKEKEAYRNVCDVLMRHIQSLTQQAQQPIKALPKSAQIIKRLHVSALLHAEALRKAGGDPAQLPPRLPNLPLKLWCKRF